MNNDYLNEPIDSDAPEQDQEPTSMSLMGGIASEDNAAAADEFVIGSERPASKLLSQGTLLVVAVAVVAAGTLYAMRVSQGDIGGETVAADVEARIEQALTKLARPDAMAHDDPLREQNMQTLFQDTQTIVDMFATDPTSEQVPLEYIKKDPFDFTIRKPDPEVDHSANDRLAARRAAEAREQALRKITREAEQLNLQTVMKGRVPVAIIDGEVLRVGQTIGSFTVTKIEGLSVTLQADTNEFILTLGGVEIKQ